MKTIPLSNGLGDCIVDDADYPELNQFRWRGARTWAGNRSPYVCRSVGKKVVWLARQLMNAPEGMVVDHINGNRLDNRRCNLRVVTRYENSFNVPTTNRQSRYRGVLFERSTGKWTAHIYIRNLRTQKLTHVFIGRYDTELDAGEAYDRMAILHHPKTLRLNVLTRDQ